MRVEFPQLPQQCCHWSACSHIAYSLVRRASLLQRRALVSLALPLSRSVVCDFVNEIQMREDIFFLSSWLILIWVYDIFELLTARQTHTHIDTHRHIHLSVFVPSLDSSLSTLVGFLLGMKSRSCYNRPRTATPRPTQT